MLPLTSGIFTPNVVPLPFVNVKFLVPVSNDAVTNAKLADVNKDEVAVFRLLTDVFNDAVVLFKLLIDTNAEALNVFKLFIEVTILAVDCDAVNVFKALILIC